MLTIYSEKRKSGISLIGDLHWGTHFGLFYQTDEDLLDILVPYFSAGLTNNELCLWVTSNPLAVKDAKAALKSALPSFDKYADKGQVEIIPYRRWLAEQGKSDNPVISRLDRALSKGFDGLRLACRATPEKKVGKTFTCHGAEVIRRQNALGVFAYPRDKFDAIRLMEAAKSHAFALLRNGPKWEIIESSEAWIVKDALKRSEEKLQSLFNNMSEGFAFHRVMLDAKGKPCDYIFLEVNETFEKLTGLQGKEIIGKKVTEVLPGIEQDPADWIGRYGRVALTGAPAQFESYSKHLNRWYAISAFSPHKGYFAVTFSDISASKRMEEELRRSRDELEKRVQERTEELRKAQQRLQYLASQLLVAQEQERKRVAVELHDGLLSELAATKYLLEGKLMLLEAGKLSDPAEFKRVSALLVNVMKEARRIMNNLHPSVLDELGLISAINWWSEEYEKSYPHIKVQRQLEVSDRDISDGIRAVIFRVLQEALNNFAKYGKGSLVELSLLKSGNTLQLSIQDNGQGFDVGRVQKGLGLESMRERVEISGGEFRVESGIGVGTKIQAVWSIS